MAPRAIWTGGLNFGLVHIPIKLYSAVARNEIDLDLLDSRNMQRVHYKRVNEDGKEVDWDEIVKGYQYTKGKYVAITDEDMEEARLESSPEMTVEEFVDIGSIEPQYYERPYWLGPAKGGEKAYQLFRSALEKAGYCAVIRFVMRERQHLGVVRSVGQALLLNTLRYEHELRKPRNIAPRAAKVKRNELRMAVTLVEDMRAKEWKPEKYKDVYFQKLEKIIKEKVRSRGKRRNKEIEPPKHEKVVDLAAVLEKSLSRAKPRRRSSARAKKGKKPRRSQRKAA